MDIVWKIVRIPWKILMFPLWVLGHLTGFTPFADRRRNKERRALKAEKKAAAAPKKVKQTI